MPILAPEISSRATAETVTLRYSRCPASPTTSSLTARLGWIEEEFQDEPGFHLHQASVSLDPKLDPTRAEQFSLRHAGTKGAWARAQGARIRVLAVSHLQSHYSIWALAGSGIKSVADLKGRRLAVSVSKDEKILDLSRAGSLRHYELALSTAGLTLGDTRQVEVWLAKVPAEGRDEPILKRLQAAASNREFLFRLMRGEVDAITGNFPAETAESIGLEKIFDSRTVGPAANPPNLRVLVAHETLLEEKPDWVVRVLARHLEAAAWAKAHPREAAELVAKDHHTTREAIEARYPNLIEGIQPDLGPDKIESLRQQKDFYLRHGFIANDFDVAAWVDPRPLETARQLVAQRGVHQG